MCKTEQHGRRQQHDSDGTQRLHNVKNAWIGNVRTGWKADIGWVRYSCPGNQGIASSASSLAA
jgi:hypothetical protein